MSKKLASAILGFQPTNLMGVSYDILKEIVRSGANLTLSKNVSDDQLRELVKLSTQSGSQITIPTSSMGYDVICELAQTGQKHVTFVDSQARVSRQSAVGAPIGESSP